MLSDYEVSKYFNSNRKRRCQATAYAKEKGAYKVDYTTSGIDSCLWWLRSQRLDLSDAAYVDYDGSVKYRGINSLNVAVRPAMWIDLEFLNSSTVSITDTTTPTTTSDPTSTLTPTASLEATPTPLSAAEVGDCIIFGSFEQDNDTSNGKEEIEWLVLAREGNRALMISRYALYCKQYNTKYTSVTWETCSLRTWLNEEFFYGAFSSDEQAMIASTKVTTEKNPVYDTPHVHDTFDKVFILSISEAEKYFTSAEARKCVPTDHAIARGVFTNPDETLDGKSTCWWWLRTPAIFSNCATYVNYNGQISCDGYYVDRGSDGVRPAMWIDFDS